MKINRLDWTEERRVHIARHNVSAEEVEDVVYGKHYAVRTKQGRYRLIGQTAQGRYIVIILEPSDHDWFDPITARNATKNERKLYLRKIKSNEY
mgnify:CR=1 FL=1